MKKSLEENQNKVGLLYFNAYWKFNKKFSGWTAIQNIHFKEKFMKFQKVFKSFSWPERNWTRGCGSPSFHVQIWTKRSKPFTLEKHYVSLMGFQVLVEGEI